jgi:DNA-binding beta-propeller fold protein YncE
MKSAIRVSVLLLALLILAPAPAQAARQLLSTEVLETTEQPPQPLPPPHGQIEGACGLAVSPGNQLRVSDYYHGAIHSFKTFNPSEGPAPYLGGVLASDPPEGPCGLAFSPSGALYANIWHQRVIRIEPSIFLIDDRDSTGVDVDETGNIYVTGRGAADPSTNAPPAQSAYVAVYDSSGEPLMQGGQPLQIGRGSLLDPYGVAVFAGRVYVPDAATDTVKVYEPASDPVNPVDTIGESGTFVSLRDAALAVDPTNGHLLVVDNLQPGFEHPIAAVLEFGSDGAFFGRLPGSPIHGGPTGIDVDSSGTVFLTSGNDELSNAFAYSAYGGSLAPPADLGQDEAGGQVAAIALPPPDPSSPYNAQSAAPGLRPSSRAVVRKHRRRGARKARFGKRRAFVERGWKR